PVHRLQEEVPEVEPFIVRGLGSRLRVDELQLIAGSNSQSRPGLGTDARPVDSGRPGKRAVRFDGDFEPARVERVDEGLVELQQRFAPGEYDERPAASIRNRSRGREKTRRQGERE